MSVAGRSCSRVCRGCDSPSAAGGRARHSTRNTVHSVCPAPPRSLRGPVATHRCQKSWHPALICFPSYSSGHLLFPSHRTREAAVHTYPRTSSNLSFGLWMGDIAFSCRTPSCHNLEYENPWDSRHSGSLGGLKCLPFLYDRDRIQSLVWIQKRNSVYLYSVNHIPLYSAAYFWLALS